MFEFNHFHTAFVTNNLYSSVHLSKTQVGRTVHTSSDRHSMNTCILLSSPEKPIVAFRERILNRRHTLVQDLFTKVKDRHFWLSWFDPGDPALGKRWKVVITFLPTTSKQYKLYRVLLYNLYIVFPIYGISTCVPGHINVRGKWFHLAQTSAKDARTAQLRPQDVSKHVPTCADIFTSWLGRLTIPKSAVPDRLEPGIQRRGLRKESSLRKIFLWGFIIQNRYYWFSTSTIQVR